MFHRFGYGFRAWSLERVKSLLLQKKVKYCKIIDGQRRKRCELQAHTWSMRTIEGKNHVCPIINSWKRRPPLHSDRASWSPSSCLAVALRTWIIHQPYMHTVPEMTWNPGWQSIWNSRKFHIQTNIWDDCHYSHRSVGSLDDKPSGGAGLIFVITRSSSLDPSR